MRHQRRQLQPPPLAVAIAVVSVLVGAYFWTDEFVDWRRLLGFTSAWTGTAAAAAAGGVPVRNSKYWMTTDPNKTWREAAPVIMGIIATVGTPATGSMEAVPSNPDAVVSSLITAGWDAYHGRGRSRDLQAATAAWAAAARTGNARACFLVGENLAFGEGVPANNTGASILFLHAAASGDTGAMTKLGRRLINQGDIDAGLFWYQAAAQGGDQPDAGAAEYSLGAALLGAGRKCEAISRWEHAAFRSPEAMLELSIAYATGTCRPLNLELAQTYGESAARDRVLEAREWMVFFHTQFVPSPTRARYWEAQANAIAPPVTSAIRVYNAALRLHDVGTNPETLLPLLPGRAEFWLEVAARGNVALAQYRLGKLQVARQTKHDQVVSGIAWLLVAAHDGHAGALRQLHTLPTRYDDGVFAEAAAIAQTRIGHPIDWRQLLS